MERVYGKDQIIGVTDMMMILGCGRRTVMKILTTPGCPVMERPAPNSPWRSKYGIFVQFVNKQFKGR